jgi:hypothetical protein
MRHATKGAFNTADVVRRVVPALSFSVAGGALGHVDSRRDVQAARLPVLKIKGARPFKNVSKKVISRNGRNPPLLGTTRGRTRTLDSLSNHSRLQNPRSFVKRSKSFERCNFRFALVQPGRIAVACALGVRSSGWAARTLVDRALRQIVEARRAHDARRRALSGCRCCRRAEGHFLFADRVQLLRRLSPLTLATHTRVRARRPVQNDVANWLLSHY